MNEVSEGPNSDVTLVNVKAHVTSLYKLRKHGGNPGAGVRRLRTSGVQARKEAQVKQYVLQEEPATARRNPGPGPPEKLAAGYPPILAGDAPDRFEALFEDARLRAEARLHVNDFHDIEARTPRHPSLVWTKSNHWVKRDLGKLQPPEHLYDQGFEWKKKLIPDKADLGPSRNYARHAFYAAGHCADKPVDYSEEQCTFRPKFAEAEFDASSKKWRKRRVATVQRLEAEAQAVAAQHPATSPRASAAPPFPDEEKSGAEAPPQHPDSAEEEAGGQQPHSSGGDTLEEDVEADVEAQPQDRPDVQKWYEYLGTRLAQVSPSKATPKFQDFDEHPWLYSYKPPRELVEKRKEELGRTAKEPSFKPQVTKAGHASQSRFQKIQPLPTDDGQSFQLLLQQAIRGDLAKDVEMHGQDLRGSREEIMCRLSAALEHVHLKDLRKLCGLYGATGPAGQPGIPLEAAGAWEEVRQRLLNFAENCLDPVHLQLNVLNLSYTLLWVREPELRELLVECIQGEVAAKLESFGVEPKQVSVRLLGGTNHVRVVASVPVRPDAPARMREALARAAQKLTRDLTAKVRSLPGIDHVKGDAPPAVEGIAIGSTGFEQPPWDAHQSSDALAKKSKLGGDGRDGSTGRAPATAVSKGEELRLHASVVMPVSRQVPEVRQYRCAQPGLQQFSMLSGTGGLAQNVAVDDFRGSGLGDLHNMLHAIRV